MIHVNFIGNFSMMLKVVANVHEIIRLDLAGVRGKNSKQKVSWLEADYVVISRDIVKKQNFTMSVNVMFIDGIAVIASTFLAIN